jgi:hypothetical protein
MSGEIEAAGAAVTAGMAAGAIERGDAGKEGHGGPCANCGTSVTGRFCAACGQPAHVHRTLHHMAEELFHGLLHFDTKGWRTLPMLFFRPGTLTHQYIHGKRARFVSPVAMFLFSVFLMFFAFAFAPSSGDRESASAEAPVVLNEISVKAEDLNGSPALNDFPPPGPIAREMLSRLLARANARIKALEAAGDKNALDDARVNKSILEGALAGEYVLISDGKGDFGVEDAARAPALLSRVVSGMNETSDGPKISTGNEKLDKKIKAKLSNPQLLFYKFQNNAYKFSFLLIPLSLPFLALLFFWKRGVTLYDHAVYVIYSLAFVSLLFVLISLTARLPEAWAGPILQGLALAIPVHMFFQLKGAYQLSVAGTLLRLPVLLMGAVVVLLGWMFAILALGFL